MGGPSDSPRVHRPLQMHKDNIPKRAALQASKRQPPSTVSFWPYDTHCPIGRAPEHRRQRGVVVISGASSRNGKYTSVCDKNSTATCADTPGSEPRAASASATGPPQPRSTGVRPSLVSGARARSSPFEPGGHHRTAPIEFTLAGHDLRVRTPAGVVEAVRTLIETAVTIESPLRCWQISLGCGHAVEYQQHASLHAPAMLQLVCDQCDTRQTTQTVSLVDPANERSVLVQRRRLELRRALEEASRAQRRLAQAR